MTRKKAVPAVLMPEPAPALDPEPEPEILDGEYAEVGSHEDQNAQTSCDCPWCVAVGRLGETPRSITLRGKNLLYARLQDHTERFLGEWD